MQKDIFLSGEGDAWLGRNRSSLIERDWAQQDLLFQELAKLKMPAGSKVLEIGCSNGSRLQKLREVTQWDCYGLEPSAKGVSQAEERGIHAVQGTADKLPWTDAYFDVVIFGFCLYLCDRADLFKIAAEADRVLKNPGWMAVLDFYSVASKENTYSHCAGVMSHKMDYSLLFSWHPFYTCYSHRVVDHASVDYTDKSDDWMSVTVLRKNDIG
jgi:ubiquinone/menaquinone biosynthesis C-methylase UbiE